LGRLSDEAKAEMSDVDVGLKPSWRDHQDAVPEQAELVGFSRTVGAESDVHHQVLPPVHPPSLLVARRERKATQEGERRALRPPGGAADDVELVALLYRLFQSFLQVPFHLPLASWVRTATASACNRALAIPASPASSAMIAASTSASSSASVAPFATLLNPAAVPPFSCDVAASPFSAQPPDSSAGSTLLLAPALSCDVA